MKLSWQLHPAISAAIDTLERCPSPVGPGFLLIKEKKKMLVFPNLRSWTRNSKSSKSLKMKTVNHEIRMKKSKVIIFLWLILYCMHIYIYIYISISTSLYLYRFLFLYHKDMKTCSILFSSPFLGPPCYIAGALTPACSTYWVIQHWAQLYLR